MGLQKCHGDILYDYDTELYKHINLTLEGKKQGIIISITFVSACAVVELYICLRLVTVEVSHLSFFGYLPGSACV